jgi:(p)ppGpp synthase/HD superfamily hydrolase
MYELLETELVERAYDIAVAAHLYDRRWDGSPYIQHPVRVAKNFCTQGMQTIALLHDVMEDHPEHTPESLVKIGIPFSLVEILKLLTKSKNESYSEYIRRVSTDSRSSSVKIADLEDNLRDLEGPKNQQRRDKYELAKMYLHEKLNCGQTTIGKVYI